MYFTAQRRMLFLHTGLDVGDREWRNVKLIKNMFVWLNGCRYIIYWDNLMEISVRVHRWYVGEVWRRCWSLWIWTLVRVGAEKGWWHNMNIGDGHWYVKQKAIEGITTQNKNNDERLKLFLKVICGRGWFKTEELHFWKIYAFLFFKKSGMSLCG